MRSSNYYKKTLRAKQRDKNTMAKKDITKSKNANLILYQKKLGYKENRDYMSSEGPILEI